TAGPDEELTASSRRISRAQSRAPLSTHCCCERARSALSTCTARHCCQIIEADTVATAVTMTMAISKAEPRWPPGERGARARQGARTKASFMSCPSSWLRGNQHIAVNHPLKARTLAQAQD